MICMECNESCPGHQVTPGTLSHIHKKCYQARQARLAGSTPVPARGSSKKLLGQAKKRRRK